MIQRTPARIEARDASHPSEARIEPDNTPDWQQILSQSVTTPEQLLERLGLAPEAD